MCVCVKTRKFLYTGQICICPKEIKNMLEKKFTKTEKYAQKYAKKKTYE